MSGPVEEKTDVNGISGTNISVQVGGDMNVIGHQYNSPSISLQKNSIWFDVRKSVDSFTGRSRELEDLHELVQRNLGKNRIS